MTTKTKYDKEQAQRFVSEDTDFVRVYPALHRKIDANLIKSEQAKMKILEEIRKRKTKAR